MDKCKGSIKGLFVAVLSIISRLYDLLWRLPVFPRWPERTSYYLFARVKLSSDCNTNCTKQTISSTPTTLLVREQANDHVFPSRK